MTVKLKNTTANPILHNFSGTSFVSGYTTIATADMLRLQDGQMLSWFGDGTVIYNDGTQDYTDKAIGWSLFTGDQQRFATSQFGNPVVEVTIGTGIPGTKSVSMVSPDFGDRTSWYQKSVQVTAETLTNPAGDYTTYVAVNPWWINMTGTPANDVSGWGSKATYTYHQVPKRDGTYGYHTDWNFSVLVNDVAVTTGFKIDFRLGKVVFTAPLTSSDVVKASYWHNNGVTNPSEWLLTPPSGKKYIIQHVELNYSVGTVFNGTTRFDIWAGASLATYGSFPDYLYNAGYGQARYDYRNARDIINAANQGQGVITAFGELTKDVAVMPFEYAQAPILSSLQGVVFRTVLLNNAEMTNTEIATATFYLIVAPA